MEDKKPYRIDESALREKFANYHVNFNASCLEILESEVAQVKTHASLELPDTKKIIRFVAIPLALIVLGCAAFFTYDYVKNLPASVPAKDTVVTKPVVQPKIETQPKQEIKPAVVAIDTIKAETPKKDTIIPIVAVPEKIKTNTKTTSQKNNTVKKDTSSVSKINPAQVDSVKKKNRVDTTSANRNKNTPVKKKKKRKNSLDATDDIRQSEPNSADDDVVVPNN